MSWHSEVAGGDRGLQGGRGMSRRILPAAAQAAWAGLLWLCHMENPSLQDSCCGSHHAARTPTQFQKGATHPGEKKKTKPSPSPLRRCENTPPGEQMAEEEAIWNNSEGVGVEVQAG